MPVLSSVYYYNFGTASVTAGSAAVTGSGTLWGSTVKPGDTLELGGRQARILEVVSNTSLTLMLPWSGSTASGASYVIMLDAPPRTEGGYVAESARTLIAASQIYAAGVTTYRVLGAGTNTPPASPITGDTYVVGTAPTGAWVGYVGYLMTWSGTAWAPTAPVQGMRAYVLSTSQTYERGASAWTLSDVSSRQPLDATLTGLAAVSTAADQMIYATGTDAFATAPTSAYGRSLLAPADAESAQILLNLSRVRSQLTTIADDTALQIALGAGVIGWGVAASQFSSGAAALFAFRATSGGYYVRLLASVGTIAVSSVPLTGTTGADGGVTLSVTSATFWIENRTGGSQPYLISLFRNT
ncbi:DUF2793 domain-containing protein [Xanthobacter sediminis]